jgi:hypothetical protein
MHCTICRLGEHTVKHTGRAGSSNRGGCEGNQQVLRQGIPATSLRNFGFTVRIKGQFHQIFDRGFFIFC